MRDVAAAPVSPPSLGPYRKPLREPASESEDRSGWSWLVVLTLLAVLVIAMIELLLSLAVLGSPLGALFFAVAAVMAMVKFRGSPAPRT